MRGAGVLPAGSRRGQPDRAVRLRFAMLRSRFSCNQAFVGPIFAFRTLSSSERLHDFVDLTIENSLEMVDGQPDPVVSQTILREVVSSNLFTTIATSDLRSS